MYIYTAINKISTNFIIIKHKPSSRAIQVKKSITFDSLYQGFGVPRFVRANLTASPRARTRLNTYLYIIIK